MTECKGPNPIHHDETDGSCKTWRVRDRGRRWHDVGSPCDRAEVPGGLDFSLTVSSTNRSWPIASTQSGQEPSFFHFIWPPTLSRPPLRPAVKTLPKMNAGVSEHVKLNH